MIRINLLPKERRKSGTNWIFNLSVVLVTLVIIAGSILAGLGGNVVALATSRKLASVERQLDSKAEVLSKVDQLEAYKQILGDKERVIETLVGNRIKWGQKLYDLSTIVPKNVWLERVQLRTVITKEKIPTPPSTSKAAQRRRARGPQYREVRTDYLDIFAVTHKLEQKTSIIGSFIERLKNNESFYSDFVSVDFQEGQEQNWIENEEESPKVWRFRLTLQIKPFSGSSGGSRNEAA